MAVARETAHPTFPMCACLARRWSGSPRHRLRPACVTTVGHSTHDEADLDDALQQPVDYLSAGPVVPTPTKPGRQGTGIGYVTMAVKRSPWPVFVTRGVTPETIPALVAGGATHFVVVRYLTESDEPARAARALSRAIAAGLEDRAGNAQD